MDTDNVPRGYESLGPFLRDRNFALIQQFRMLSMNLHLSKLDLVRLYLKLFSATVAA